ncbi:Soluble lytic murein transglycosylase precursor [Lysobacter dokdonensis DS-58]|uniref:Soluble lytic murein transglycosylase n=1 Tax=Lysobacter dokdonensis DS-58 TaxID=1300345 RepID=A0A0A2WHZ7_9GAMM|nr:lytic transglycosylase domain-containing protein [Lysobacter dokdonensis]KGQ18332.1 Soluble lytic murein transglycosylase precursor [Lysobacter dokdonensis DS-58]
MLRHSLPLFACLLCCASSPSAFAQQGRIVPPPLRNAPILVIPQRDQIREALSAADRGTLSAEQSAAVANHPLAGWVEFAQLKRDIDSTPAPRAQAFLQKYKGQALEGAFRELWLAATARREDWPAFRSAWKPSVKDDGLRCAELEARAATGAADAQWIADAQAMWRSTGKPLPATCDAPFSLLASKGGLPATLRWERIEAAAKEWEPAVMRSAARGLPAEDLALANDYAAFFEAVHDRALTWPKTPRSRLMASQGLARLAKSVPMLVDTQLPKFASALQFTEEDRARPLYQAALWTVASYEPDSARRLNAVPASAYDDRLHEWRVREALSRSDWPAALAGIRKMGDKQRGDSRWTYFQARLTEITGDKAGAQALYRQAARKPEFHGFLAADRIGEPYALCPVDVALGTPQQAAIARDPAIVRALALYQADRPGWAQREWDDALSRFDDTQRRLAVAVAQDHGWFDRAVFALGKRPEETRMYGLRFPLHHDATIRREATKNGLDPAWVAAEIRAESVFNPNARSGANAMGLMQVVPATGLATARRIGLAWNGPQTLYDPDANIAIGTAYLRQLYDKYGPPYMVLAGYNAGPAPLARWKAQRPGMDPDFWIETISYKETREYVARVLAFSVIYDWRLNGDAAPVSDRMRGSAGKRKAFACPAATPAN